MRYLKPKSAFLYFRISNIDIEKLDITKLYKCFIEGKYDIDIGDTFLENHYLKLPRAIRYHISESHFCSRTFESSQFYPYDTDEKQIIIDYANVLLEYFPDHKKTLKIMKNLKEQHPELFI